MLDHILTSAPMERVPPARLSERMDRLDCDPDRLRDALETLSRANRRFGARSMTVAAARSLLEGRPPGRVRMLDVGTGSGDIAAALARRLSADGWRPYPVLTDLHPVTLEIARERQRSAAPGWAGGGDGTPGGATGPAFVRLNASALPFPSGSVDLAVSATMLHHLERSEAKTFLAELDRVTRRGWVVTDLCRSRTAYLAVRLLAATLWRRHPLPRRDGPVSVRRAFTAEEARGLVEEAGLADASVERLWPFRLRITGRTA